MARLNIITQRKKSQNERENKVRRRWDQTRMGCLNNELKSSIYRLQGRASSQLRTPTLAAARSYVKRNLARLVSQLRGPRELLELVLDKSFFHLELCLFLVSATSSSFW